MVESIAQDFSRPWPRPEACLAQIDALFEQDELANYYPVHSARADMYRARQGS